MKNLFRGLSRKRNAVGEGSSPQISSPSPDVRKTTSDTAQSTDPSRGRGAQPPCLSAVVPTTSITDQPTTPYNTPSSITAQFQPDAFISISSETLSSDKNVTNGDIERVDLVAELTKELARPQQPYGPSDPIPTSLFVWSETAHLDATAPTSMGRETVSPSSMIRLLTEELARHPQQPYGPSDPIPTSLLFSA